MNKVAEPPAMATTTIHPAVAQALASLNPSQPEYWNAIWRGTQEISRASGRRMECWQNWDEVAEARKYWQRALEREQGSDGRLADVLADVQPGWRVLDIGAGPGNLAVPLAAKVAHVTAVEPADGMATVLRENIEQFGLRNVHVVQKKWDDVDACKDLQGPYDLVVISFAFGMLDLLDTVEKILSVARNRVLFYWHLGPQVWDVDAVKLWPLLHGKDFTPIPKAEVIFNLLYSMGIYADATVMHRTMRMGYDSFDEAMDEYRKRYAVPANDSRLNALLKEYLLQNLVVEEGRHMQKATGTGMRLAWTIAPCSPLAACPRQ
ncbi:MAG: class I SAM-dependent methyltransferase [Brachymonas sp.]|nr:class I SAM-dependent methyltransferase [Brachymonas sp.]MBP8821209.1 class I SAM-dependent methyltransferase [Brachymonas sp.]MBP9651538.1 class I SAM-dependent methyltransferase [Brachymonas sp.]